MPPSTSSASSKRSLGSKYEQWVADRLQKQGYHILTRNYRCRYGEIDIIAVHDHCLVLIEVKTRTSTQFGQPFQAVTSSKLAHIANAGEDFRSTSSHKHLPLATRIDVASVLVNPQTQHISFELLQNVS